MSTLSRITPRQACVTTDIIVYVLHNFEGATEKLKKFFIDGRQFYMTKAKTGLIFFVLMRNHGETWAASEIPNRCKRSPAGFYVPSALCRLSARVTMTARKI